MKKYLCGPLPFWQGTKISLTMKLTTLFLIVSLFQVQANSYGQQTKLTLDFKNTSVAQIFNEIESVSEFRFLYESNQIDLQRKTSLKVNKEKIFSILDVLFESTNIDYKINGRQIILTPKKGSKVVLENVIKKKESDAPKDVLQHIVSGTVHDDQGMPLPGASIVEKGTTNGTQTDFDGNFSIQLADENTTLIVSYVGFATKEVAVNRQPSIHIILQESASSLDEVVLVGYGVVNKRDMTGATSSLKTTEINEVKTGNVLDALKGKVAGLRINSNNGEPGAAPSIRIRGNRSISASNDPLIILDGFPFQSSLSNINQNDIESMEVLKDASATAIYGSRGANGVIVINTKRGSAKKTEISYNGYGGPTVGINNIEQRNAVDYINFKREAYRAIGAWSSPADDNRVFELYERDGIANGTDTNWWDLSTGGLGFQQSHNITILGGNENTQYKLGVGYFDEDYIWEGSEFERFTLNSNFDHQLNDKFKFGVSTNLSYNIRNYTPPPGIGMIRYSPLAEAYDSEGNFVDFPNYNPQGYNPLWSYHYDDSYQNETEGVLIVTNLYGEYKIANGLTFRSNITLELEDNQQGLYFGEQNGGANKWLSSGMNDYRRTSYNWNNIIRYNKQVNEHELDLMSVFEAYSRKETSHQSNGQDLPLDVYSWWNLGANTENITIGSSFSRRQLLSGLVRAHYSFKDRYLLTLTMRADGASQLAEGNKWDYFPAAAFAWRISDENFMESQDFISDLKFRASYGVSGNAAINPLGTLANLGQVNYFFGENVPAPGLYPSNMPAPFLGWEKTATLNLGLDFNLFKNRLSGSFEWYNSKTTDLLLSRLIPSTTGFVTTFDNVGSTATKGIELGLNANVIRNVNPGFNWNVNLNLAKVKEELTSLYDGIQQDVGNRWFLGEPALNLIYTYEKQGIWQMDEMDLANQYGQVPGEIRVKDQNEDNVIDEKDRVILGYSRPDWIVGLDNTFKFKNFDFSAQIYSEIGGLLKDELTSVYADMPGRYNTPNFDYWTPENPSNEMPRPNIGVNSYRYSESLGYVSRTFLKIRNLSLGYTLDKTVLGDSINSIRLYLSARDPFVFSKYDWGYDPEKGGGLGYPSTSAYLIGLDVKF